MVNVLTNNSLGPGVGGAVAAGDKGNTGCVVESATAVLLNFKISGERIASILSSHDTRVSGNHGALPVGNFSVANPGNRGGNDVANGRYVSTSKGGSVVKDVDKASTGGHVLMRINRLSQGCVYGNNYSVVILGAGNDLVDVLAICSEEIISDSESVG